jgi:hypothetical protein
VIAGAITRIPSLSEAAREAIAKISPAMLEGEFGGNVTQREKHLPAIFGSSAEMTSFVEKNRLLDGEQLAKFLGAARDQQAEMLAQALSTRYGPYGAQLRAGREETGQPGFEIGAAMGLTAAHATTAIVPAAPLNIPSQAEIDAIEAARKALPKKAEIEQLQQEIDTIKAGLAVVPGSMRPEMQAAIARLQEQIGKIQALPGYQEGGIVPGDQAAQLHAGEMVLPANISSGLQNLITLGQSGSAPALTTAVTSLGQSAQNLAQSSAGLDRIGEELGSSMASGLADLLTHARGGMAKDMQTFLRDELRSSLRDSLGGLFKGFLGGMFPGSNFSLSGLGQSVGSWLGGSLIGNPFASAAGSGILGGLIGNPFSDASGGLLGGSLGGVGGFFSSLFGGGLGGITDAALAGGFARGGIVSAAGGWVVPSFAEGGILSMLHAGEMVLPANISQFVQDAAGRGGGGHTFNMNISAWDSRDVMRAGPALVASINKAVRNGSSLGHGIGHGGHGHGR